MPNARKDVHRIETLIQQEVGRNTEELFDAARGGLWSAALALSEARSVAIISGFYVPLGQPPAAETDGPVGAALLGLALRGMGITCRLVTDEPCKGTFAALVRALDIPLDVVPKDGAVEDVIALWRNVGVTHVVSIERCGRSIDGTPRNMLGEDIGEFTTLLDDLFLAEPWKGIAIGDGGNELGMGSLSRALICEQILHGEKIACVTPADYLIVAGVSNWGAYGLIGAMAVLLPQWRSVLLDALDEGRDEALLKTIVDDGPSVDGVTRKQNYTVDGLAMDVHHAKLRAIRDVVNAAE